MKSQLVCQLAILPIFLPFSFSSSQFRSKCYLTIWLKHALPSPRSWFNFLYRPLISSCGWLWLQNKLRWSLSCVFWKTSGLVEQSCYWLNFMCFINLKSLCRKRKMLKDYSFLGMTDFREDSVPYFAFCLKVGIFFSCTLDFFVCVPFPTIVEALYIPISLILILLRTVRVNICNDQDLWPNWLDSK